MVSKDYSISRSILGSPFLGKLPYTSAHMRDAREYELTSKLHRGLYRGLCRGL